MKYIFGRAINEFVALKTLSLKELKYKLMSKGIKRNLIEDYIQENKQELEEYEVKSAKKVVFKKKKDMSENEIINFLKKKGYQEKSINNALNGGQ